MDSTETTAAQNHRNEFSAHVKLVLVPELEAVASPRQDVSASHSTGKAL